MTMQPLLTLLERIGDAVPDAWVVVDPRGRVVEMNRPFHALFSRAVARKLRESECCEHLKLSTCDGGQCLARRCLADGRALRLDEIEARIEGEATPRRFIVSAVPLSVSDEAPPEGALIVLRDVSDQAGVQRKYQEMLTEETQEKERLRGELQRKTRELMETHQVLNQAQQALMAFKKGLVG